jgi:hypothetical protein
MLKNDNVEFLNHLTRLIIAFKITPSQMWYILTTWMSFHVDKKYLPLYYEYNSLADNSVITERDLENKKVKRKTVSRITKEEIEDLVLKGLIQPTFSFSLNLSEIFLTEFCVKEIERVFTNEIDSDKLLKINDFLDTYPSSGYVDTKFFNGLKIKALKDKNSLLEVYPFELHDKIIKFIKSNLIIINSQTVGNENLCMNVFNFIANKQWEKTTLRLPVIKVKNIR